MRAPKWGELQSTGNPEAYRIWLTKDDELDPCEPCGMLSDYIDDGQQEDLVSLAALASVIADQLTTKSRFVFEMRSRGHTLDDVAAMLTVTRERIRQIEQRTLRQIRWIFRDTGVESPFKSCRSRAEHPGFAWESELT